MPVPQPRDPLLDGVFAPIAARVADRASPLRLAALSCEAAAAFSLLVAVLSLADLPLATLVAVILAAFALQQRTWFLRRDSRPPGPLRAAPAAEHTVGFLWCALFSLDLLTDVAALGSGARFGTVDAIDGLPHLAFAVAHQFAACEGRGGTGGGGR